MSYHLEPLSVLAKICPTSPHCQNHSDQHNFHSTDGQALSTYVLTLQCSVWFFPLVPLYTSYLSWGVSWVWLRRKNFPEIFIPLKHGNTEKDNGFEDLERSDLGRQRDKMNGLEHKDGHSMWRAQFSAGCGTLSNSPEKSPERDQAFQIAFRVVVTHSPPVTDLPRPWEEAHTIHQTFSNNQELFGE